MGNKKGEVGIGTVVMVILAVVFLTFLTFWAIRQMGPTLGENVEKTTGWLGDSAHECGNIPSIDVTQCSQGVGCDISIDYTDINSYPINIPLTTEYWVDIDIQKDCCWADENVNTDDADNCSGNDPELYIQDEYQPLVYQIAIGDTTAAYVVDVEDCCSVCNNEWTNVSVYMGVINKGSYNLKWRIVTDWGSQINPADCKIGAYVNPDDANREGKVKGNIRVYCEV